MNRPHIEVKKGRLNYGIAMRNPDTYEEGEYRVYFYASEKSRDRATARYQTYMPEVVIFQLDIAELADLK